MLFGCKIYAKVKSTTGNQNSWYRGSMSKILIKIKAMVKISKSIFRDFLMGIKQMDYEESENHSQYLSIRIKYLSICKTFFRA